VTERTIAVYTVLLMLRNLKTHRKTSQFDMVHSLIRDHQDGTITDDDQGDIFRIEDADDKARRIRVMTAHGITGLSAHPQRGHLGKSRLLVYLHADKFFQVLGH